MCNIAPHVHLVEHPLARHHLTRLRCQSTPPVEFRQHVRQLAVLLACDAARDLREQSVPVTTPLAPTTGSAIVSHVGLVPILRAGLGMVDPILELLPESEVWHLGFYRDEKTAQPVHYYSKLPDGQAVDVAFIIDPMLATGGSVLAAVEVLQDWGVREIKLLSIIASRHGIDSVTKRHPQIPIHVCAVDPELNDRKFIVPGLGDAGDRTFNTPG